MIRMISDTSTLYAPKDAEAIGAAVTPLSVNINGNTYREYADINATDFIKLIQDGGIPSSSQPSIGEKMELYERYPNDDIIDLAMADGLSGTYQSACGARENSAHKEKIHVVNTKTLCGPHRYLLEKAIRLTKESDDVHAVLNQLQKSIDNSYSYLMPQDFAFLKRGGRLTPMAATIGGLLKMVPIMTLTEGDVKKLEKLGIKRTLRGAFQMVAEDLKAKGIDGNHLITISHALCPEKAIIAKEVIQEAFPDCEIWMLELSPVFITQGGPDCIAIQSILK